MQIFYKIVFDISCYYTFTSFFLKFALGYEISSLSMSLFLLAGLLVVGSQKISSIGRGIALLSAILPILFRPWKDIDYALLEFFIPWVYFVLLVYRENYGVYYANFKSLWKGLLYACIILVIVLLFDIEKGISAAELATPYFLVFLTSGILLMQNLRFSMESTNKKAFEKYQIKQTICFFIFCFLLTASRVWQMIYQYVVLPLKNILISILFEIVDFFISLFPKETIELPDSPFHDYREYLEKVQETIESNSVPRKWGDILKEAGIVQEKPDVTPLLIVFGALIAIIIFAILMGHGAKKTKQIFIEEEREELPQTEEVEKTPTRFSKNAKEVVRFYYKTFMRKAETAKQLVYKTDTTNDILEKFLLKKPEQKQQAEEVTKIYQKTRYSKQEISDEEVRKIKRLVKNI